MHLLLASLMAIGALGTAGCGSVRGTRQADASPSPPAPAPAVVRGQWSATLPEGADTSWLPAAVTFTLSNAGFIANPPITDTTSYGSLAITKLRDASLSVCGANGTTRCTAAGLRIYTQGEPGAGMWNTATAYGAPVSTGGNVIGLTSAGAYVLKSVPIAATLRVVQLSTFTTAKTFAIPISVNYANAGVGAYKTTLVVEYYLQ